MQAEVAVGDEELWVMTVCDMLRLERFLVGFRVSCDFVNKTNISSLFSYFLEFGSQY